MVLLPLLKILVKNEPFVYYLIVHNNQHENCILVDFVILFEINRLQVQVAYNYDNE